MYGGTVEQVCMSIYDQEPDTGQAGGGDHGLSAGSFPFCHISMVRGLFRSLNIGHGDVKQEVNETRRVQFVDACQPFIAGSMFLAIGISSCP